MKGKDSGGKKGFAFVTFRSVELAAKAIEKLNNTKFKVKYSFILRYSKFFVRGGSTNEWIVRCRIDDCYNFLIWQMHSYIF